MKKRKDLKEKKSITSLATERKTDELKQYMVLTFRTNKNKSPFLDQYYCFKSSGGHKNF